MLTLLALAAVPLLASQPPAGAQRVEDGVRLTITSMSGVLGPGSVLPPDGERDAVKPATTFDLRALVEHGGEQPLDGLRLVVEVHPATTTRGLLRQALNGDLRTDALYVHTIDIADGRSIGPGDVLGIADEIPREQVAWSTGHGGVHPVRVAVVRGTAILDEVVTAVVWLGQYPTEPLLAVTAWPLTGQPWRGAGGAYPEGADQDLRPGGRLDALTTAARMVPSARVNLIVPAHLLEDLADRADGYVVLARGEAGVVEPRELHAADRGAERAAGALRRIRDVAAGLPFAPLTGVYADADVPALLAGDATLRELAAVAAGEGRRRAQLQLGREIDASTTVLDGPVSPAMLDLVPTETVLLPYASASGAPLGPDPVIAEAVRPVRAPSGRMLTALVGDPYLEEALGVDSEELGSLLTVQRTVAESAMAYLHAPATTDRGIVLLPPPDWSPTTSVAYGLLRAVEEAVWLRPTTPGGLATSGRRSATPVELASSPSGPFGPVFAMEMSRTARDLEAAMTALPTGTGRMAGRPVGELRDDLLRSATWWERGPGASSANARIREVQRAADATFGRVTLVAGDVTLTSTTGQVPVTLQRVEGGPVRVLLEVVSGGRLQWPEGRRSEVLEVQPGETQTVTFTTEAVSTGTFPVRVRVLDPTGAHEIASGSLSVRSTAFATNALLATGVLVLVLLLFGALRRRGGGDRGGPHLAAVPSGGGTGPPEADERPFGRRARGTRDDRPATPHERAPAERSVTNE